MLLSSFLGRHAADEVGAVLDGLLAVEGALLAGEALTDHAGLLSQFQVLSGCIVGGVSKMKDPLRPLEYRGERLIEYLHFCMVRLLCCFPIFDNSDIDLADYSLVSV